MNKHNDTDGSETFSNSVRSMITSTKLSAFVKQRLWKFLHFELRIRQQVAVECFLKQNLHNYRENLAEVIGRPVDFQEWCANDRIKSTLSDHSLSAITNLYVDDEPKENQSKQYFSRKNSVLRIPIPPRSSNRMSTNEKLVTLFRISS